MWRDDAFAYSRVMAALADMQYRRLPALALVASGRHMLEIGSAILQFSPKLPIPLANRVYNIGVDSPATREHLADLADAYRARNLPYRIELSPLAKPAALDGWIDGIGGTRAGNIQVFRRGSEPVEEPSTRLRVARVGPDAASDFLDPYIAGLEMGAARAVTLRAYFDMPQTSFYAAYDDRHPVAGAWTFIAGSSAYFAGASTKPTHRRLGAQSALLARRIKDALRSGCREIFVDTDEDPPDQPNPSFHNVRRAGFEPSFLLRVYEGGGEWLVDELNP